MEEEKFYHPEKLLDQIVEDNLYVSLGRVHKYLVFTDSPVSNFDTERALKYVREFYGKNFVFTNMGNLFERVFENLEEPEYLENLGKQLLNSRLDQDDQLLLEDLIYRDPLSYEHYWGLEFSECVKGLVADLKKRNKLLFPEEYSYTLLITGRCIISKGSDGRNHARSFFNNVVSTSGMYYGPDWGVINDPKITDFGKIIVINTLASQYDLDFPRHSTCQFVTSPTSDLIGLFPDLSIRITPEKEKILQLTSAQRGFVSYFDLIKKLFPESFSNPNFLNTLLKKNCLFFDAHRGIDVDYHNMSGELCFFHQRLLKKISE